MKTEWVVMYQNKAGSHVRIAYRTAALMANGLQEQTAQGWVAVSVVERERRTYAEGA